VRIFRRKPVETYAMLPRPTEQVVDATPDLRTQEQKLRDQARVDALGFPRFVRKEN
jgi:hypothetical protein